MAEVLGTITGVAVLMMMGCIVASPFIILVYAMGLFTSKQQA